MKYLIVLLITFNYSQAAMIYKCGKQKISAVLSRVYVDGRLDQKKLLKRLPEDKNFGLFLTFDYGGNSQSYREVKVTKELVEKFKKFAKNDIFQGVITIDVKDGGMTPTKVDVIDFELPKLNEKFDEVRVHQMISEQACPAEQTTPNNN